MTDNDTTQTDTTSDISLLIKVDVRGNFMVENNCLQRTVLTRSNPEKNLFNYRPADLYAVLHAIVKEDDLLETVTVKGTGCLWGCTFGPRIDVVVTKGNQTYTVRYGSQHYKGDITKHGSVEIHDISALKSLRNVIYDNL